MRKSFAFWITLKLTDESRRGKGARGKDRK